MDSMRRGVTATLLLCCCTRLEAGAAWETVDWDTPTPEPGKNANGAPVISGGMPIGNGDTTATVFPVTKAFTPTPGFVLAEGVHIWLNMATAMASDTALMPLGLVSITTDPPLGTDAFSQRLFVTNATVVVRTAAGGVLVWVDAESNRVVAESDGFRSVNVTVQSLRPAQPYAYYGRCSKPTSQPDVLTSSGAAVTLSHRNADEDIAFLNKPAGFNATLEQQGMGAHAAELQRMDKWRHRQFGFTVSGAGFAVDSARAGVLIPSGEGGGSAVTITTLAAQTPSSEEWNAQLEALHKKHVDGDDATVRAAHANYWTAFWNSSHVAVSGADATLENLTVRYALTRYVQAIQAGTWVPLKFNGELFTQQLPPDAAASGPSFRNWGSCSWWQNTRLPYWTMHAAGDFAQQRTVFDFYLGLVPFWAARTQAAFNHTGLYATETKTLFGAYDPCDYGTPAASRTAASENFGYQQSRYLKFDFGGDAGLPELCVMLLDHYEYTLDDAVLEKYLPLLTGTLDFFARHYGDVQQLPAGERLKIFPTQALETYQCPTWPATPENCPTNDHPTLAGLHVLTERALDLPAKFGTAAERAQWAALAAVLPPVPMMMENGVQVVSPYETFETASTQHNDNIETPELYSTHPYRYFTVGRSLQTGERKRDIAPSLYCLDNSTRVTCRNADNNLGWTQGLLNAALLGRADKAAAMTLQRAQTAPSAGFRFPVFAPAEYDYGPSADHYANMNAALQLMLLAPADDGLAAGGVVLFPAWPCAWDVDFKLRAPRQTTVSGKLVAGKLVDLVVEPAGRRGAVTVLPCQ